MLSDLLRALPAALMVGIAPGWFWAKLLARSADLYERLAYSVALSMALVPAAILVPTRMLGMGVTLPLAVVSPLAVFCLGLVSWLRFGAAKGSENPIAPLPRPLGVGPLILLCAALGLAVGVAAGALPGARFDPPVVFEPVPKLWVIAPIALLVLLAGGLEIRRTQAQEPPASPQDQTKRSAGPPLDTREQVAGVRRAPFALARRLLLPAVLLLALVRGYSGPVLHDWPFVRGVDHYSHAVMAHLMMTKGKIEPYLIYPPGFHSTTATISRLSGLEPLELFPVLAPLLLLLPALALYSIANRLWGWECGVAAAFFSVLLGGTYYYYNDAMYPNLVTSQFLMVLAVSALVSLYGYPPSVRGGFLFALLGSSVVLYHQVASMYLAVMVALVGLLFVPYLFLLRERSKGVELFLSLALLGVLSVIYAWGTYDMGGAVAGLFSGGSSGSSSTVAAIDMAIGTQYPYLVVELVGNTVSQPVAWFGLLGVLLAVGHLRLGACASQKLAYSTLVLWTLMLAVGACTSASGFPQRFGRDLGIPLAVLAAFASIAVLRSLFLLQSKQPVMRLAALASLAVLSMLALMGVRAASSIESASNPSSRMTITPQIAAAGEWLKANNEGGNIMVSPQANQVPSRMMLAMGDYSALQSFERWQIEHPRDLPPTGPEPLEDVLWVMTHPRGERTDRLLETHNVDYVVLYKNMPDRVTVDYWKGFKALPNLYRKTFENEDVLIVTRRGTAPVG